MAERRMFAKSVVESDLFHDMPMSAQSLYYSFGMNADDDGFVGNPKSIMRSIGASEEDIKIMAAKGFIVLFESGIILIRHWKINNRIKSDRYRETKYLAEKALFFEDASGAYLENGAIAESSPILAAGPSGNAEKTELLA